MRRDTGTAETAHHAQGGTERQRQGQQRQRQGQARMRQEKAMHGQASAWADTVIVRDY